MHTCPICYGPKFKTTKPNGHVVEYCPQCQNKAFTERVHGRKVAPWPV